ncbi:MAG: hypothetical protein Q4F23_04275 [Coriobacteriia bacterium]|nr:hypothetical protein [Coriobacteriia bacterium]
MTGEFESGLIEVERLGSLNLSLKNKDRPVEATNLYLYRLAELKWGEEGSLWSWVPGEKFVDLDPEKLKQNDETELARALESTRGGKPLAQQTSDSRGNVTFEKLPTGMYLVTQGNRQDSTTNMSPFCVCIPMLEDESYVYDVDATPKVLVNSNEVTNPKNHQELSENARGDSFELPKTGDVAPLALVAVLLLLSLGGCCVARGWPSRKCKPPFHYWKGGL